MVVNAFRNARLFIGINQRLFTAASFRVEVETSKASITLNSFPDPYTAGTCEQSDIVATWLRPGFGVWVRPGFGFRVSDFGFQV